MVKHSRMQYIVTTTIFAPSKAIQKFASLPDWTLIVGGDKKTPHQLYEEMENIIYLHPDYQEAHYKELSDAIGWNCIQRRNIGFIEAYTRGAEVIASVDDDNIPYDNWGKTLLLNTEQCVKEVVSVDHPTIWDPLAATNHKELWHRGFPINRVVTKNNLTVTETRIVPTVQADFWDGDPDVDAIERMIFPLDCKFEAAYFPFTGKGMAPFNSQNTFFHRSVIKDFFCFPHVGRMDDIWGSFYTQAKGHRVIYNEATVFQERNPHNYLIDFSKEYDGYMKNETLMNALLKDPDAIYTVLPERSAIAFRLYQAYFSS